jgi:hypothetical protein
VRLCFPRPVALSMPQKKKSQGKGKKRAASPDSTSKTAKRAKTGGSSLNSGSGTQTGESSKPTQPKRLRKTTVVSKEEDNASHAGVEIVEEPLIISDDEDGANNAGQSESENESSEAELSEYLN